MIRKLNYTGRKRIPGPLLSFILHPAGGGYFSFESVISLEGLELPKDADVHIEAYHRTSYMRFPCGKVGKLVPPVDTVLDQFEPGSFPLFRVKVVKEGRILASADKIVPRNPEEESRDKLSLLPVEFKDLEELVWNLDMSGERPILQLNNRIDGIKDIARSDHYFFSLVYPVVIGRILRAILVENSYTDPEFDEDDWQSQWLRFALGLPEVGPLPAQEYPGVKEDREEWVDRAVAAFCRKWRVRESFVQALREY